MIGQAVARGLGDPDRARDDRVEDEGAEVLAHLALDVGGQPRAAVAHRDQDARDREPRVEPALDQVDRLHELRQPLERVVLGLDRHDRRGRRPQAR